MQEKREIAGGGSHERSPYYLYPAAQRYMSTLKQARRRLHLHEQLFGQDFTAPVFPSWPPLLNKCLQSPAANINWASQLCGDDTQAGRGSRGRAESENYFATVSKHTDSPVSKKWVSTISSDRDGMRLRSCCRRSSR